MTLTGPLKPCQSGRWRESPDVAFHTHLHPSEAAVLAAAGDEIWVAQGHYSGDVTRLAPGVRMIGGFLGTEEVAEGRGLDPAGTILMPTNNNPVITIDGSGSSAATSTAKVHGLDPTRTSGRTNLCPHSPLPPPSPNRI